MAQLVNIRIDRGFVKQVRETLGGVERKLDDCSELFEDFVKDVFVPSADKTFDAEGRPAAWKPLSEAYALQKARKVGHTQILVYSEKLRDSVATASANEYAVREYGERRMLFGTTRPWAYVHQENRPFLVVQDEDYRQILDMTTEWLTLTGRYAE